MKSATRNDGNVLFTEVCRQNDPALFLPNRSQKFRKAQERRSRAAFRPKANFCERYNALRWQGIEL